MRRGTSPQRSVFAGPHTVPLSTVHAVPNHRVAYCQSHPPLSILLWCSHLESPAWAISLRLASTVKYQLKMNTEGRGRTLLSHIHILM